MKVPVYKGEATDVRINSLRALSVAAQSRRSVIVPGSRGWNMPRPAAFMIQLSGEILLRLLRMGMYIYQVKSGDKK